MLKKVGGKRGEQARSVGVPGQKEGDCFLVPRAGQFWSIVGIVECQDSFIWIQNGLRSGCLVVLREKGL